MVQPGDSVTDKARVGAAKKALFTLHIAEYEALMNRCTYFIALHVGIWGLVISLAVFAIQQWSAAGPGYQMALLWIGGSALQALLHIQATIVEDQYNAVAYIEKDLRSSIATTADIPERDFWGYELALESARMKESWWGEWIIPAGVFILLVAGCYWRRETLLTEVPFVLVNVLLVAALALRTRRRLAVRRSFARNIVRRHADRIAAMNT